jgi:hypothetical protein
LQIPKFLSHKNYGLHVWSSSQNLSIEHKATSIRTSFPQFFLLSENQTLRTQLTTLVYLPNSHASENLNFLKSWASTKR